MKKFISLFIALAVLLGLSTTVAYAAIPSGITGSQLYAGYVIQDKSNWCWAASAENAIIWEMSPTRDQWDAVYHIKGWLLNPYPNVSGSIFDSRDAAEYISKNTEEYIATESSKSFAFVSEQVYNSHPVINGAGYYSSGVRNGGHATVIVGWSNATGTNRITYYDSITDTRETCTFTAFCNGTYNSRRYDQTCYNSGS